MTLNNKEKYKVEQLTNEGTWIRCSPENLEYDEAYKIKQNLIAESIKHNYKIEYKITNMKGQLHELLLYETDLKKIYSALISSDNRDTELLEHIGYFIE